jgi:hypothetical protein
VEAIVSPSRRDFKSNCDSDSGNNRASFINNCDSDASINRDSVIRTNHYVAAKRYGNDQLPDKADSAIRLAYKVEAIVSPSRHDCHSYCNRDSHCHLDRYFHGHCNLDSAVRTNRD